MKTILLLSQPGPGTKSADLLVKEAWPRIASRVVVQLGMAAPHIGGGHRVAPAYDAVVEIWSDALVEIDAQLSNWGCIDVRSSHEVVGKPAKTVPTVGATPGISQISFIRTIDGMSRIEAKRHWDQHIPLACAIHVGMNRYVQDRFSPGGTGAKPWFGMAHLHFPDVDALRDGLFRTPEDIAVISADVAEFVSYHATMLAIEHVVKG